MASFQNKTYTPPRLIPAWALKIASAPATIVPYPVTLESDIAVDVGPTALTSAAVTQNTIAPINLPQTTTVPVVTTAATTVPVINVSKEVKRCPLEYAPRAPAAMSPAIPQAFRGRRIKALSSRTPYKQPPRCATASILDYQTASPFRQKVKLVVESSIEKDSKERLEQSEQQHKPTVQEVPREANAESKQEEEQSNAKNRSSSGIQWDPVVTKEFIPRLSTPVQNCGNVDLTPVRIDCRDWAVSSEQSAWDDRTISPLHSSMSSSVVATGLGLNTPHQIASDPRLVKADSSGRTPRRPSRAQSTRSTSSTEAETFEYSTPQREADYRVLFKDSTIDTTEPVYTLSRAPEYSIWSEWRDEYTEDYLYVLRREHHAMNTVLEQAFTMAKENGFNMKAEGLEVVRSLVWLGHDYSERGIYKFNEQLAARTRNEMMRIAGVWRRINLEHRPLWYASGEEIMSDDEDTSGI